jgi:hypothetical protein
MLTSRRTLVAGLVAVPVATAAVATTASADPIFAALARHRAAFAALETINEVAEPGAYAAAQQELLGSHDDLFATEPQTISGCKALVDFLLEDAGVEDGQGLDLLSRALDRLAA